MKIGNLFYLNHQISDLNGDRILKEISPSQLKRMVDILVIDDEEFPLLDDLKKHGFNIEYKKDVTTLKDVEPYPVILCDIHGVGKFLNSDNEGAYLVHLIKKDYPSKIVISYTADTTSPNAQKYLHLADNVVKKGTSIEDWATILTDAIENFTNPVNVWKKVQSELFRANVPTKEIAFLECKYVKAIKTQKYESLKNLVEERDNATMAKIFYSAISALIKLLNKK